MNAVKPTLSLCMIMKNEERWIAQCLKSVQGLVDEIVIVDTGSTDRSIEIAKSFGAKVYEHAWEDDFSKSRNRSLDYATGEWILVLDADEVIATSDKEKIIQLIKNPPAPLIFLTQLNYIDCSETYGWVPNILTVPEAKDYPGYVESKLVRLFKKSAARFQGVVHEHAEPLNTASALYWSDIYVHHYGKYSKSEIIKKKNDLYFKLGLKKIELSPHLAQAYYELGAQYIEHGSLSEAKEILLRGEKVAPTNTGIQLILAHVEMRQNNTSSAIQRFLKVLEMEPQNVSPYIYLPGLFIEMKQFNLAEEIINKGEVIVQNYPSFHINKGALKVNQGNYRKAIRSYLKAIEINPRHAAAHLSLAACYVEIEEWENAEKHYQIALESKQTRLNALKGLGKNYFKQKKYDQALIFIEKAIAEMPEDSLEKNLLFLWKAVLFVIKEDNISAKQSLQKISSFNDFEEIHLNSLNECLKKISTNDQKGVFYGNQHT